MAISTDGMIGYIRIRADGSLYIDPVVKHVRTPGGMKVTKPADCAGILYGVTAPNGDKLLEVRYPAED